MAPEQLCGEHMTPATDQFSFCVSLWELVYGERPFSPEKIQILTFGLGRKVVLPQPPAHDLVPPSAQPHYHLPLTI